MSAGNSSLPEWLVGAVDLHVHCAPSLFPRRYNDHELVAAAARAGLGGVVLKAHEGETVARALLAGARRPEVDVYGGVVLNRFVGGFNAYAVEVALSLGGRLVWMPTLHAGNHIRYYGGSGYREQPGSVSGPEAQPLSVLDENERLLPEVGEVLEALGRYPAAVLSSGHLSAREALVLFREASRLGLERLLVTHPLLPLSSYSLDVQRQLAEMGAVIEHCFLPHTEAWGGVPLARVSRQIREVGVERCLISTDLGQRDGVDPAEGLTSFAEALLAEGFSRDEVRRLAVSNPRRLLSS